MQESKKTKITNSLIPKPGFILIQCIMFGVVYGMGWAMPWWAMWFPSLVMVTFIVVILLIALVGIILAAIGD